MSARPREPSDTQDLSDDDQTASDRDQTEADLDHTTADADQSSSERDQFASDRDQEAADRDQDASDRAHGDGQDAATYTHSRRARSQSALERDRTSQARADTARIRDGAAARRDRVAAERDAAARARDRLAARLDEELEMLAHAADTEEGAPVVGMQILLRAAGDRKRAAASRARAAAQREAATEDRARAAEDRRLAALDRQAAAEELAQEGLDHLTGALRRRVGLGAMQREMDRTRRASERLIIAFVDVVGLKAVNDTLGHGAGDELIRAVATSIMEQLRSYDVITRYGGDEFVCSLAGLPEDSVRERFDHIAASLGDVVPGATITVGLAERRGEDSLAELIDRADQAMIATRRSR